MVLKHGGRQLNSFTKLFTLAIYMLDINFNNVQVLREILMHTVKKLDAIAFIF